MAGRQHYGPPTTSHDYLLEQRTAQSVSTRRTLRALRDLKRGAPARSGDWQRFGRDRRPQDMTKGTALTNPTRGTSPPESVQFLERHGGPTTTYKYRWTSAELRRIEDTDPTLSKTTPPPLLPRPRGGTVSTAANPGISPATAFRKQTSSMPPPHSKPGKRTDWTSTRYCGLL